MSTALPSVSASRALPAAQRVDALVHQHPRARLRHRVLEDADPRAGEAHAGARACLADALHRQRVAAQVGEAAEVVEPGRGIHLLEHPGHAAGGEAGRDHHLEADPVGLALHVAREVELALDVRRLGAGDDGLTASGLLLREAASRPMIIAARLTSDAPRVARDAAGDVPLRHVRQLVPEHRRELVAGDGDGDQAEVHADEAAGQGERVDALVAHQERLPGEALVDVGGDVAEAAAGGHERIPDRLHVLEQQRIVEIVRIDPDLAHDLVADLALGADAEVGGIRIAERRQVVLRRGRLQHRRQGDGQRAGAGDSATQQVAQETARWRKAAARRAKGRRRGAAGRARRYHASESFPLRFVPRDPTPMSELTHFDADGQAHMVDVSAKAETHRVARAGGRDPDAPGNADADRVGQRPERRRHRRRPGRRDPGRQAHRGARAPLPPDRDHPHRRRVRGRARRQRAALHRAGRDVRPHRRRDGGADRGAGRPAHGLRHVQGGRPRDGDRRRARAREARRQVGRLAGRSGRRRLGAYLKSR